jgi:hypothetical protein
MRIYILLAACALLLSGCMAFRTSEAEIARAEARWNAAAIPGYRFDLRISALTPVSRCANENGAITVIVRNSRTAAYGTCAEPPAFESSPASIPALFQMARDARQDGAPGLKIRFDQVRGYPQVIQITTSRWITDATFVYSVDNFQVLSE